MEINHMARVGDTLVASEGAYISYVSQDGEIMAEVPLQPGMHRAAEYIAMAQPGQRIEFGDEIFVLPPAPRMSVMEFPPEHMFGTAAKQQYRMSDSTRAEMIRQRTVSEANAAKRHADAILRRMERAADTLRQAEERARSSGEVAEAEADADNAE